MNTRDNSRPAHPSISLFLTDEHPCAYIDGLSARTLFADPTAVIDSPVAEQLQENGFRRSGRHHYRPACRTCSRCVPVRIPVGVFKPSRSHRRNRKLNHDISYTIVPDTFDREHYQLYRRYVQTRHADGQMADDCSERSYRGFLTTAWGGESCLMELRNNGRLVGVAVTDIFPNALSAVYTFFDPELEARAPGTHAILAQIELAKRSGLDHLYLGYWISDSPKMRYKERFRPLELWNGHTWIRYEHGDELPAEVTDNPRA